MLKIGNIVTNEYNNTGKLKAINNNEAVVEVFNYGIQEDEDYCDIRKCRLATEAEIHKSFQINE